MNVKTSVTIVLTDVDDYLSWSTQLSSFVIMRQISGMIDGTIPAPSPILSYMHGFQQPNPGYHYWVHVDQLVRSWIFATISKDLLCKVCDIMHAFDIWKQLEQRFNMASLARALDLKRMFTRLSKDDN